MYGFRTFAIASPHSPRLNPRRQLRRIEPPLTSHLESRQMTGALPVPTRDPVKAQQLKRPTRPYSVELLNLGKIRARLHRVHLRKLAADFRCHAGSANMRFTRHAVTRRACGAIRPGKRDRCEGNRRPAPQGGDPCGRPYTRSARDDRARTLPP